MADGSWLLYDKATGTTHAINATAGFIWTCCDGEHTLSDIGEELQAVYDVINDVAQRDVQRVVAEFGKLGIVEGVE